MRALLVVNPMATTTSERGRDVLVRALRSAVEVEVAYTRRRGHATSLARQAAEAGLDVVVTLGGDGTVNEAVNGIMTASTETGRRPALAVVPGGSTNVFSRALGQPKDWAEATGAILEALREGRSRLIGLGMADDRYFTFCGGLGLDAAVIRRVERARLRGRVSTPGLYLRAAASQYTRDWASGRVPSSANQPAISLERPDEPPEEKLATVIVQNTSPWTYLGDRAINPNPAASFDLGLDVMALRALHVPSTTRTVTQLLFNRPDPHGRQLLRLHDVAEFTLRAGRAQAFQLDGDYLGERDKVRFTAVPDAIQVIC
jgi:diacylglycerol kinase family enzyme